MNIQTQNALKTLRSALAKAEHRAALGLAGHGARACEIRAKIAKIKSAAAK